MRGAIDLFVEQGVFPGVNFRVVRQLPVRIQHRLQHVEFRGVGETRTHRRCRAFEALAHIVEFSHRAQIMLRHRQTAAGRMDQHAVGLQAAHRLANRRAADFQPGAKLEFENALTGFELAFLDRIADRPIGMLGQPAGGAR